MDFIEKNIKSGLILWNSIFRNRSNHDPWDIMPENYRST